MKRRKIGDGMKKGNFSSRKQRIFVENIPRQKTAEIETSFSQKVPRKIIKKERVGAEPKRLKRKNMSRRKRNNSIISFLQKNHIFVKRFLFVFLYGLLIVLLSAYFEKTIVEISPHLEKIQEKKEIEAFLHPGADQLGFHVMAVSEKRSVDLQPEKEQKVQEYAQGAIKVFNNYSREPQRLAPHTRFKSLSGKVYLIGEKGLVIPGKTSQKPGVVEVQVKAQKPGASYNIDVTDFTIPGFKEAGLDAKYNGIYALSTKSFKGGFTGTKKVVDSEQKKRALESMEKELEQSLRKRIAAEKTEKAMLIKDSFMLRYDEPKNTSSGEIVTIEQTAKAFVLLLSKDSFEKKLNKIFFKNPEQQNILSLDDVSVYVKNNIDIQTIQALKTILLEVNAHFLAESVVDKNKIKQIIKGQKKVNLLPLLQNMSELDYIRVQIQPFWRKHVSLIDQNIIFKEENKKE